MTDVEKVEKVIKYLERNKILLSPPCKKWKCSKCPLGGKFNGRTCIWWEIKERKSIAAGIRRSMKSQGY